MIKQWLKLTRLFRCKRLSNTQWVVVLLLVVIGFYSGRYLGALGLLLIYYWFFLGQSRPPAQNTGRHRMDEMTNESSNQAANKAANQAANQTVSQSLAQACELLGVTLDATPKMIENARKKKISQCHPDKLYQASIQDKRAAADNVIAINQAYHTIKQYKGF
ncbi:J domain-containing protein [Ostreibacterium oceani]|uniref:J domain-containing protein n=1 Tax=Ostreibacterium oceani TaxID=2654998 RepID=A0A6N7EUP4_9GAMM|nr:J domain-containing protein [Ostreibacterium oceani]MPV86504.1 hypothetical protein [Ostreibacterium oceani]